MLTTANARGVSVCALLPDFAREQVFLLEHLAENPRPGDDNASEAQAS